MSDTCSVGCSVPLCPEIFYVFVLNIHVRTVIIFRVTVACRNCLPEGLIVAISGIERWRMSPHQWWALNIERESSSIRYIAINDETNPYGSDISPPKTSLLLLWLPSDNVQHELDIRQCAASASTLITHKRFRKPTHLTTVFHPLYYPIFPVFNPHPWCQYMLRCDKMKPACRSLLPLVFA